MSWIHTRALIARTVRDNPNADLTELRRQLRAERLEDHVSKVMADTLLTPQERRRITALLRPAAGKKAS